MKILLFIILCVATTSQGFSQTDVKISYAAGDTSMFQYSRDTLKAGNGWDDDSLLVPPGLLKRKQFRLFISNVGVGGILEITTDRDTVVAHKILSLYPGQTAGLEYNFNGTSPSGMVLIMPTKIRRRAIGANVISQLWIVP